MATDQSGISWTDGTLNSLYGCTECSKGCDHCYAIDRNYRFASHPNINRDERYNGLVQIDMKEVVLDGKKAMKEVKSFTGTILFNPARLYDVLKIDRAKLIFVNEFSDLLHRAIPMDIILEHFRVFRQVPHCQFQILTKRANRLGELDEAILREFGEWPKNVWQGVSVCSSAKVEMNRIVALGKTHAKLKWISFEPWLSDPKQSLQSVCPDLRDVLRQNQIAWTVIGGESGSRDDSRLMTLEDARHLCSSSRHAECKVHFKQLGTKLAQQLGVYTTKGKGEHRSKGGALDQIPDDLAVREWPTVSFQECAVPKELNKRFAPKPWKHFTAA